MNFLSCRKTSPDILKPHITSYLLIPMTVNKPKVASSKWRIASINNPEGGQHLILKTVQTRKITAFQSSKELEK